MRASELTKFPTVLYHATLAVYKKSIRSRGLVPGGDCQMFSWCDPQYVYFADNQGLADSFVDEGVIEVSPEKEQEVLDLFDHGKLMVTVDVSKLDTSRLTYDPNLKNWEYDRHRSYAYQGVVPVAAIKSIKKYHPYDIGNF